MNLSAGQPLIDMLVPFAVAMLRPGAMLLVVPLLPARAMPVQLRILLAAVLAVPVMDQIALPAEGMLSLAGLALLLREVFFGLAIGFIVQLIHSAALLGGEIVAGAMGLSFAASVDPVSGQHAPIVGSMFALLSSMVFFASGGHLLLVRLLMDSYALSLSVDNSMAIAQHLTRIGSDMFLLGLALALPVAAISVLTQIALGFAARATPQLNLFAVGLPVTLAVGLILLAMLLPDLAAILHDGWARAFDHLDTIGTWANVP